MSRPRAFNAVGFEKDGATVLTCTGAYALTAVCSVRCACGAVFTRRRENLREPRSKLRCLNCRAEALRALAYKQMAEATHNDV